MAFSFFFFHIRHEGNLLKMDLTCFDSVLLSSSGGNVTCEPSNGHCGGVNLPRWTGGESMPMSRDESACQSRQVHTALLTISWYQLTTLIEDGSTLSKQLCLEQNTHVPDIKEKVPVFVPQRLFHRSLPLRPSPCSLIHQSHFSLSPTATFSGWSDHHKCIQHMYYIS